MSVRKKHLSAVLLAAVVCTTQILGGSVIASAERELNPEWREDVGMQEKFGTVEIIQYGGEEEVQESAAEERPNIQTAENVKTEGEFDCVYDFVENSAEEGTLTITYKSGRPGKVIKFLENSSNVKFLFDHNPLLRSVSFSQEREYSGDFAGCSNLTSVHLPDGLRVISRRAFEDCSSLEEIVIPESVEEIEESAFFGCTSLRTVSLPKSVKMSGETFFGCTSLKEITIPEGVEKIEDYTFSGCSSLEKITIPEGVTSIGRNAFSGCSSLRSIELPDGITSIEFGAFSGCSSLRSIELPDGITSIEFGAFSDCVSLSEITIPESVEMMDGAFLGCTALRSIKLPSSLTSGEVMFEGCSSLEEVTIPEGVTSIGEDAFKDCSSLEEVTIPEGVTSIGRDAFSGCSSLRSIELPDGITSIEFGAFWNCAALRSINLPSSLTSIEEWTFPYCSSLSEITIPENIKIIKVGAFFDCVSLSEITIPRSVEIIQENAFDGCSSLKRVELPEGLETFNIDFERCDSLEEIVIGESNPNYTSIDGVLYNKQKTELVSYPYGKKGEIRFLESVERIGKKSFCGCGTINSFTIPSHIKEIGEEAFDSSALSSVVIPDSVELIEHYAFQNTNLTELTLPDSLTVLGNFVFSDCSNLRTVIFPENMKKIQNWMFKGCTSLTDVTLPDLLENIGFEAFANCDSLQSISIPRNVKYIDRAFIWSKNLKEINVAQENETFVSEDGVLYDKEKHILYFCPGAKTGEFSVPDTVTTLEEGAFLGSALTSIEIPESVTVIKDHAFECSNLRNVVIPSGVTEVGAEVFSYSKNLEAVAIPEGVTKIGSEAFRGCESLQAVTIPSTVKEVDRHIFYDCKNLKTLVIKEGVECGFPYAFSGDEELDSLTVSPGMENWFSVKIKDFYFTGTEEQLQMHPDIIKRIENMHYEVVPGTEQPYEQCDFKYVVSASEVEILKYTGTAEDVVIPSHIGGAPVVSIAEGAFDGCASVNSISIPEGVTDICSFSDCFSLEYIVIPASMVNLKEKDLLSYSLKDIYFRGSREQFAKLLSLSEQTNLIQLGMDIHYEVAEGEEKPYEKGDYRYTSDVNSVEIVGYQGTEGDIVIPSEIEGKKVTGIAMSAFAGNGSLTSVKVSQGVTFIGSYAFDGCYNMVSISLPVSVTNIARNAFWHVKEIYYEGSREQWHQIKFEGTGYEDKTIHFGVGDPTDDDTSDKNPPDNGSSDKNPPDNDTSDKNPPDNGSSDENPGIQKPVSKKEQKLICTKTYSKAYGNKPFKLTVKKEGDGRLGYASSNNKVATVNASGTVTIKGTGAATITVTAEETANYQASSEKILIKASPAKMSLKSVKTVAGKKLKVSWKKNAKATGYELQYSTDKKFKKKKVTKSLTIKKNKTTSAVLKKLTKGKKYFVRIRAYKNAQIDGKTQKLYSTWSSMKKSASIRK